MFGSINYCILQIALGSKRGDNYTSMLYRIQLYGDNGWSKSLIYKCLPDNRQARNTYKSEILFNNEVTFYTKSFTALMKYQVRIIAYYIIFIFIVRLKIMLQEHKKLVETFNSVPQCYLAQSDIVILEDMRCKGFTMLDRMKGLDFNHCRAILRQVKIWWKYDFISLNWRDVFIESWENSTGYRCL